MVTYRALADLIVILHAGYVTFVVVGLLLILLGVWFKWSWVRNFWFRMIHLSAIAYVALEAIFNLPCPLTRLETDLREKAGEATYSGDFLGYWAHELLFYNLPQWYFNVAHVLFCILVVLVFWLAPPRWPWRRAVPAANIPNQLPA